MQIGIAILVVGLLIISYNVGVMNTEKKILKLSEIDSLVKEGDSFYKVIKVDSCNVVYKDSHFGGAYFEKNKEP